MPDTDRAQHAAAGLTLPVAEGWQRDGSVTDGPDAPMTFTPRQWPQDRGLRATLTIETARHGTRVPSVQEIG